MSKENKYLRDDAVDTPSRSAYAVTPNDTTPLSATPKGLYIAGAGDLAVQMMDDSASVTFTAVPAGTVLPIRPSHVLATGTTATGIVALA